MRFFQSASAWLFACSLFFPLFQACSRKIQKHPEANVILISAGALRADHLSCYGYERKITKPAGASPGRAEWIKTSPNLDTLAKEGSLFTHAFCQVPSTLPSTCSLLTSTYPSLHGVWEEGMTLEDKILTLAEVLKENGWSTAAFVGFPRFSPSSGLSRGFEYCYDCSVRKKELSGKEPVRDPKEEPEEDAQETMEEEKKDDSSQKEEEVVFPIRANLLNNALFDWLERNEFKKNFLWIHYFEPTRPYSPPPPFDTRFSTDFFEDLPGKTKNAIRFLEEDKIREVYEGLTAYDGEIAFLDKEIWRLYLQLKRMGRLRDTLLVFTSAHGEGLGEHGWLGHEIFLYDEQIRVPLILMGPGIPRKKKLDGFVESIDIAPTILAYLGLEGPPSFEGQGLIPMLEGTATGREWILSQVKPYYGRHFIPLLSGDRYALTAENYALRDKNLKMIYNTIKAGVMFDLERDPGEITNIWTHVHPKFKTFEDRVKEFRKKYPDLWRRFLKKPAKKLERKGG